MKDPLLRPKLVVFALILLFVSTSVVYGSQTVYGREADGKPTNWVSLNHNSQNLISSQSNQVKQDPGAAGGGEGRPTDWESPRQVMNLEPMPAPIWTQDLHRFELFLNLFAWWFSHGR